MIFVVIAVGLFFVSEFGLMIARRSAKTTSERRKDRYSLLLFWIVIPVSVTAAFLLASWSASEGLYRLIRIAGLVVFAAGMLLRWAAILQLRKAFTVDVAITGGHELTTGGIYARVRHPSYSGLMLMLAGTGTAMLSWASLAPITLPVLAVLLYRIRIEEEFLTAQFGDGYRAYSGRTKKLIPWIF